jgi:hypothetical protein
VRLKASTKDEMRGRVAGAADAIRAALDKRAAGGGAPEAAAPAASTSA